MGITSVIEGAQSLTPRTTKGAVEDVDSGMGEMRLRESNCACAGSGGAHANVAHPELDLNNVRIACHSAVASPVQSPPPKFTRNWSFVAPAHERKARVEDMKTKGSNLRVEVSRALARSWSFTKTTRSPQPALQAGGSSNVLDSISLGKGNESASEQEKAELFKALSPLAMPAPSIDEDEDHEARPPRSSRLQVENSKKYNVKPLYRTFVAPSEPLETHWLPLSNLDRVVNPTFSSVIHYYENAVTEDRPFAEVTRVLKESLAKTLVDFYPLAGRLELGEDGKVDLHCNSAGAMWIEAQVDADLKSIGGAKPNHRLSGFDFAKVGKGPLYIPDQISPMPVLIIQATKFTCGAVAVATSWHHTVADGFSGTHFMRSWAEVALGKPISLKPMHARDVLKARNPPNPTLVNGYSTKSAEDLPGESVEVKTTEPAEVESFGLDKDAIAELKTQANIAPPPFTPRPYSSAESISGHLWRQMTKARATANSYNASLAKDQTTKFFMFVDGRKRLRLPGGYFGNVVCSACAVAKEADILNNPLTYAAGMIRTATRNITEEYFRSLIDWVELQGMASSKSEHVNSLGHDVAATFWTFFPLYEIEFGWGRPVFAARNSPPRPLIDGIAMMPNSDGKGMVALLNLHSDRMSKLQRQISFATVFH